MLRIRNYFIAFAVVFAISSAYALIGVQDAKADAALGDLLKRIEALESKGGGNVTAPGVRGLRISGHIRTRANMKTQFHVGNSASRGTRAANGSYTIAVPAPSTSSSTKHIGVSRNQNYIVQRIRLAFDFDINKNVLVHAMFDSNRTFGGDQSTIQGGSADTVSMKQAYFKLRNLGDISPVLNNVTLLVGRKQWAYGDQRLIGHLNWTNVGRTHDGAIVKWQSGKNWVDLLFSQVNVDATDGPGPGQIGISSSVREEFVYGFYSHFQDVFGAEGILAEPYLLVRDRERSVVDGVSGETRYYGGLRIVGKKIPWLPGLDFTAEQVWQWGEEKSAGSLASNPIQAFGGGWKVGYRFGSVPWTPRIGYEFVYASGDDKPPGSDAGKTGSNKRFSQLYPLGHAHLGYMDQHGWENIEAHRVSLNLKPTKKLVLNADLWFFEAAEVEDGWRSVGGGQTRVGGNLANSQEGGVSRTIRVDDEFGQELDLVVKYKMFKNFGAVLGYSHYWQGDFMEDTNHGNAPGADWFWVQTVVKF